MQKYPNTGEMASTRYSSETAAANETGVNKMSGGTTMAQSSSLSSSSSSSGLTLDDSGKIIKPGRSFDDGKIFIHNSSFFFRDLRKNTNNCYITFNLTGKEWERVSL